jgi:hypothetical protein
LFGDHNSKIYYDRWYEICYGAATNKKKSGFNWIFDFNNIRTRFLEIMNDPVLETVSSVATQETFEISGGNAKEFIIYKRHCSKTLEVRKVEEDDYQIGQTTGLINLFC